MERILKATGKLLYGLGFMLALLCGEKRIELSLKAHVFKKNKGCALDFGCGERGHLPELAGHYSYVVGMDMCMDYPEKYSLRRAKMLVRALNLPNVELVLGDCHNPPFRNEAFDLIVCTHVLEHLKRVEKAMIEIKRMLKENGRVFIVVPWLSELTSGTFSENPLMQFGKVLITRALDDLKTGKSSLLSRIFFKYDGGPNLRLRSFIPKTYYARLWYKRSINLENYCRKCLEGELLDPHHKHWFTRKEWSNIVRRSGLGLLVCKGLYHVYIVAEKPLK
jgi:SAM-dependent methyltransferase